MSNRRWLRRRSGQNVVAMRVEPGLRAFDVAERAAVDQACDLPVTRRQAREESEELMDEGVCVPVLRRIAPSRRRAPLIHPPSSRPSFCMSVGAEGLEPPTPSL